MSTQVVLQARFVPAKLRVGLVVALAAMLFLGWMIPRAEEFAGGEDNPFLRGDGIYTVLPAWALQLLLAGSVVFFAATAWRLVRFMRARDAALTVSPAGLRFTDIVYLPTFPLTSVTNWSIGRGGWFVVYFTPPPGASSGSRVRLPMRFTDVEPDQLRHALSAVGLGDRSMNR